MKFYLYFISLLVSVSAWAGTQTFTVDTHIINGDTSFSGEDIIVDNCTLTIDGAHSFNSIILRNNAVLTHSPATAMEEYKLVLTIAESVTVNTGSKIDVSGRGYPAGYTWSVDGAKQTDYNSNWYYVGASYGGYGYPYKDENYLDTYGDFKNPNELGSGGGVLHSSYVKNSRAGGGLIRLKASKLTLDGQILANGKGYYGSGSGGGIRIDVNQLTKTQPGGLISANGGGYSNINNRAGGGGRVAIYCQSFDFDLVNVQAFGGSSSGSKDGGAGTVYLEEESQIPVLRIANNNRTSPKKRL